MYGFNYPTATRPVSQLDIVYSYSFHENYIVVNQIRKKEKVRETVRNK